MSGFFDALALLTRVPTRGGARTERAVPWLPVVGAMVGAAVAGIYALTRDPLGPVAAAVLAIGAGIVLTGALHEDGLADTVDAFGAGVDREETLAILKDPAHGTYGVLALVLSVVGRVAAVATLSAGAAAVALPAAHALGRGAAAWMLRVFPPATPDGLGATYAGPVTVLGASVAAGVSAGIAVPLLGLWGPGAIVVAGIPAYLLGRTAGRRIGGVTGDVLGAAEQVAEIGVLLLAAAAGAALPWGRV